MIKMLLLTVLCSTCVSVFAQKLLYEMTFDVGLA